ncbi:cytochrome c biogenesis protein ResB [Streptomyces sp. NPDC007088]|uniref:cytochrome c biogenesis protein ResB n=1 Tax=Streptomyces sp. NPDC007088 TaxID=3364773 RepID=UPI003675354C
MSGTQQHEDTRAANAEEQDLGAAGAQLSTAPVDKAVPGSFGGVRRAGFGGALAWTWRELTGWVRWFWRQLTSMRVALILLFLLSLGAVPGSLIPQQGSDELKVADFRKVHTTLGPLYDKLGLFHVYSSVWFSAIYILLFVSLIGCIIPRTWQFVGQLRGRPPRAPGRLDRMPAYTTWRTEATPEQVQDWARSLLRKRRYRADAYGTGRDGGAVAAEKGYLREAGNLVFHVALIVMLVAFATGSLFKSEGGKLVIEGDGFSNTRTQYDDFKSGSLFSDDDLAPYHFTLDKFTGTYETTGPNKGTPRVYTADVTWSKGADGKEHRQTISPNHPLDVDGSKVFLNGHGYAPVVTVRDRAGKVIYHGASALLPLDANGTAQGAIKVADGYTDKRGKPEQLGFNAFFVPTFGRNTGMLSTFPGLGYPVLALSAYHGDLGIDSGIAQNVYQLDKTKLKEFKDSKGQLYKKLLLPGETMKLPGGAGSVTFEKDIKEWASFQISQQPGAGLALGGAIAAIAGLAGSLFIQRRRVWVRARTGADGVTVVEMAGLGRSESAKLPQELSALVGTLHDRAPTAPGPDPEADGQPQAPAPSGTDPVAGPTPRAGTPAVTPAEAEGAEK